MSKLIPKHQRVSPVLRQTFNYKNYLLPKEYIPDVVDRVLNFGRKNKIPVGPTVTVVADDTRPKEVKWYDKSMKAYSGNEKTLKEIIKAALKQGYQLFYFKGKYYKTPYSVKGKNEVETAKANSVKETIGDLPTEIRKLTGLDKVDPNTPLDSKLKNGLTYRQAFGLTSPFLVNYKNRQLALYGITSELALDKSSSQNIVYLYAPFGDYNLTEFQNNILSDKKLFYNGQPTWDRDNMPGRNRTFDHARIDLRNLSLGYPLLYQTFSISPFLMNNSQPYYLLDDTYDDTERAYLVKTIISPIDGKTKIVLSDGAVNLYTGVGDNASELEIEDIKDEELSKTFRSGFLWEPISSVSPYAQPFIRMSKVDNRFLSHPTLYFKNNNQVFNFDTSVNTNVRPMNGEDSYGTSIVGRGIYPNGIPYSSHYDEWDLGLSGIPLVNTGQLYIYNRKSDE